MGLNDAGGVIKTFRINPTSLCNMQDLDLCNHWNKLKDTKTTLCPKISVGQGGGGLMPPVCDRGRVVLHLTAAGVNLNNKCH